MRFKRETLRDKYKRLREPHRYFAWFPVKTDTKWVWLEYVMRSLDMTYGDYRFYDSFCFERHYKYEEI